MPLPGSDTTTIFNASATGHETQPTICLSSGPHCRTAHQKSPHPLRLGCADTCRHLFPAVIHTSSWWFHTWDIGYLCPGMALHYLWSKTGFGKVWGGAPTPPLRTTTAQAIWCGLFLPHLRPVDSLCGPRKGTSFPHLRGWRLCVRNTKEEGKWAREAARERYKSHGELIWEEKPGFIQIEKHWVALGKLLKTTI